MAKKTTKTQKETKKTGKSESTKKDSGLQKPLGRRRPLLGAFLLFMAVILSLAGYDYSVGQDIFLVDSHLSFLSSTTEIAATNICGKVGATLTSLGLWTFGVAYFMIVIFMFYVSLFCFRRSPRLLSWKLKLAMPLAVFSLAMSAAVLQRALNLDALMESFSSAYMRNGWGGVIAMDTFEGFFKPIINVTGSLILFFSIYFVCVIMIFVENPKNLCEDLVIYTKHVFNLLKRGLLRFFKALKREKKEAKVELESKDTLLSPSGKEEINITTTKPKKAKTSPEDMLSMPSEDDLVEEISLRKSKKKTTKIIEPEVIEENFEEDDEEAQIAQALSAVNLHQLEGEEDESVEEPMSIEALASTLGDIEEIEPISPMPKVKTIGKEQTLKIERYEAEKAENIPSQVVKGDYVFPTLDLLTTPPANTSVSQEDYQAKMDDIINGFATFKIKVVQAGVSPGPVITRYEVRPAPGVRVNKIANLEKDLAMILEAERVRIIAPVPGKGTVGIEVPNEKRLGVYMRDILESVQWTESKAEIPIALGKDVTGVPIVLDLAKMPHALIAGSTGSGKSVCVNSIIASLCYKYTPDDIRFIMVDPKVVELQVYNSLPHMLVPVVTDAKKAPSALKWLLSEMGERYRVLSACGVKNIASFNAKILKDKAEAEKAKLLEESMSVEEKLAVEQKLEEAQQSRYDEDISIPKKKYPYIVCIIDELAALMAIAGKEVEGTIVRLTQEARAAGIHLILATQRPSTNVITGLIKANLPVRIAFKVSSFIDSRTILDAKGAETLIGRGDMLFIPPGTSDLIRAQGAYLDDPEIEAIIEFLKQNGEPKYVEEVQSQIDAGVEDEDGEDGEDGEFSDPMVNRAIETIRTNQKASISLLQRKLSIGYGRASRIMDILEEKGLVGSEQGPNKARDIFL